MHTTQELSSDPHPRAAAVLFVDDEERALRYFMRAFGNDFRVVTASNAARALELLDADPRPIGVVISDQRMPGQRGVDLLRAVRLRHPQIVRLLTTAYADLDEIIDAVNDGEIYRYVLKPWNVATLRKELAGALDRYTHQAREQALIRERRATMLSIAANIAHELRTPLASIGAATGGLRRYLPTLLEVYQAALERGDRVPVISPSRRRTLDGVLAAVEREVEHANMVIDLLLMNARADDLDSIPTGLHSMGTCIAAALERFPFEAGEHDKVHLDAEQDFLFEGSEVLFTYLIFNLLKNALYAVAEAGKGDIRIRLAPGETYNRVHVRDTGTGIPAAELAHIFDDFFSSKRAGVGNGLGLAFAKRIVTAAGGEIRCHSEEGVYTELVLSLPRPESTRS